MSVSLASSVFDSKRRFLRGDMGKVRGDMDETLEAIITQGRLWKFAPKTMEAANIVDEEKKIHNGGAPPHPSTSL